jgi:hypothetical protein
MIQAKAETLGQAKLEKPLEDKMTPYVEGILEAADLFPSAAGDLNDADSNRVIFVGMNLALFQATQSTRSETKQAQRLDELFEIADRKKVRDFDEDELSKETRNLLRPLANVGLFTNPQVVKQLLPPGSREAERFAPWVRYDDAGNPMVTIPAPSLEEEQGNDPSSWGTFVTRIVEEQDMFEGGVLAEALRIIDDGIERAG